FTIWKWKFWLPSWESYKFRYQMSSKLEQYCQKLPHSWNDYRKKILHSREKYFDEEFITNLQIESETHKR
ncbi:hypothetical protein Dimus_008494, partial [Dionaea muscipula]